MRRPPPLAALARFVPHVGRHARATRWLRTRGRPRVWAHRGDSAHFPENTLPAFEAARRTGADGIELDLRCDADGTVIVFHDDSLDRLCGRPGRIEQLSASERQQLRVRGEHVPTFTEVLDVIGDMEVDVEIKASKPGRMGALAAAVARAIRDSGRAEQMLVSSFDPITLLQVHAHLPEIAIGFLFHEHQPLPFRRGWIGSWMGASLVHPENTLCTEETVKAWHRAGLAVNVWTVDDAGELDRLARLGIDGVCCNDPAHALAVFEKYEAQSLGSIAK